MLLGLWLALSGSDASANTFNDWVPLADSATLVARENHRSAYYGGFYPTDGWFASFGHQLGWESPVGRSHVTQMGEFWLSSLFGPGAGWSSSVLEGAPRSTLGYAENFYLVEITDPLALVDLVPKATRIWGWQASGSTVKNPETEKALCWRPDYPGSVFEQGPSGQCSVTNLFDPHAYPLSQGYQFCEVTVPAHHVSGSPISYQYYQHGKRHDEETGEELDPPGCEEDDSASNTTSIYYVEGQYRTALQIATLAEAARNLAIAHERAFRAGAPEDLELGVRLGRRAAAILLGFAQAFPHWKRVQRYNKGEIAGKHSVDRQTERFLDPTDPAWVNQFAGVWRDRLHSGLTGEPTQLAIAYDLVQDAGPDVWDFVDTKSSTGNARMEIELELFWPTVEEALSYDLTDEYSEPRYALLNLAAYQARALMMVGAAIDAPEVVRYGLWKTRQLIRKGLMHDRVWPEGPAYFKQTLLQLENGLRAMENWVEPPAPAFVSAIVGSGVGEADVQDEIGALREFVEASHDVLDTLCRPDQNLIPRQDTGFSVGCETQPPNPLRSYLPIGGTSLTGLTALRPYLLQGFAHGVLARGLAKDAPGGASPYPGDDLRLDVGASANWNHAHSDRLATLLWAHGTPVSYEYGGKSRDSYVAADTLNHNTVRLGRRNQDKKLPEAPAADNHWEGQVLAWHPVPDEMQVIELQDRFAYRDYEDPDAPTDAAIVTDEYRRTLFLIPVDDPHRVGAKRNLVLDLFEVATTNSHPQEFLIHGRPKSEQTVSVVAEGTWSSEEDHFGEGIEGEVFQPAGGTSLGRPVRVEFQRTSASETDPELALWILGPESGFSLVRGVTAANPGASFLAIERDVAHSRFVVLWEPIPVGGEALVTGAELLDSPTPDATGVRIEISDGQQVEIYDNPSRNALHWPSGIETRGRFVGLRRSPEDRLDRIWLYEASAYVDPNRVGIHAEPRIPRPITELGSTNHPHWYPAPPGLPYEPVAKTDVDPQWMVQVRTTAAMPNADGVDCADRYRHSRWIPLSDLPDNVPDILQIAPVGGRGPGFVHDPGAPTLRDTHNPFHTRYLCDSADLDWPKIPILQWPERAVLEQASDGMWRVLEAKSNVPAHVDPGANPLPDAIPTPEPAGALALAAGILCLYALSARAARRREAPVEPRNGAC